MSEVKTPWKDYMGDVPMHLDYFQGSMFEAVERMAERQTRRLALRRELAVLRAQELL